jgi:hypothetical protein
MLAPPWFMYQGLERRDSSWQSGKPAEYLAKWTAWYRSISAGTRTAYSVAFREPKGWSGFYKSVVS